MRICCCHLLTNAPPPPPPPPNLTPRCTNEVAAETVAACSALCCCPLAVIHLVLRLLLLYPCIFLIQQARCKIGCPKRRTPSEPGTEKFNPLDEDGESPANNNNNNRSWKQPVEISVGFVIKGEGCRAVAFDRSLRLCGLQVKRRIGVWKERRLVGWGKWRRGSKGVDEGSSTVGLFPWRREGNESLGESEEGKGVSTPLLEAVFRRGGGGVLERSQPLRSHEAVHARNQRRKLACGTNIH